MILGENIEHYDQIAFNSLQGKYEDYKIWRKRSFVEFWSYLMKSNRYIESINKGKDKKPDLTPDFWESIR